MDLRFKHMVCLFYELDVYISLKQAFLSFIPTPLVGATKRALQARRRRVIDCPVSEIQEEVHLDLNDICRKKQKWKYMRKKRRFGKKFKSSRCYICNRLGHFAKNCPNAPKRGVKPVQQLKNAISISLEKDDWESLFLSDKELGLASIATLEVHTDYDSDFSEPDFDTCYMAAKMIGEVNLVNSVHHVPFFIYSSKRAKPI
ncbi:hypothetical protein CRG98_014575 [Punica granatum]|uniref:CCHC-type domain-containing protein n=1 Tax=Punica granatum TaxID=22663 RepID=A0A2I0KBE5_PUNGR|nr:hypothetical protein CRG98_014575 [Punica granatum]